MVRSKTPIVKFNPVTQMRFFSKLLRQFSSYFSVIGLFLSFFAAIPITFMDLPRAEAVTCESGAASQNNISVEPSHGKVLYIDTGVSPRVDGAYVGYRVTNSTGSTIKGWWVSLSSFSGGIISLANSNDQYMQLPEIANNSTKTVYFLLKATSSTKVAQSHTVKVFNGRPDVAASTSKYTCDSN